MISVFFCGLPQIFRRDERLGGVHTNNLKVGYEFHLGGLFECVKIERDGGGGKKFNAKL